MSKSKRQFRKQEVIHPDAAGIDIGSGVHYACVPIGRSEQRIKKFRVFSGDIHKMIRWFRECGVTTVAMESTGSYWIPVFQLLETHGFEVCLVNARHIKNVPGRKTDVSDCQWLQELHTFGLLKASFRPEDRICRLRSLVRQRERILRSAGAHVQKMQKAMTEMNIHLHTVISDITGTTGLRIIEAVLDGERDIHKLAELKDGRIRSKTSVIAEALKGDYRQEHIFVLHQEYEAWKFFRNQLEECDNKIESYLNSMRGQVTQDSRPLQKAKNNYNRKSLNYPSWDLRAELHRVTGVDFTAIDGLDILSVQTILAETGFDPFRWKSAKHFTSWLGLSPNNRITGEKVMGTSTRKVNNRAARAFRMCAFSLIRSKSALGAYCRRMRQRLGAPKALTATARKLACIFYSMLRYGTEYVDKGQDYYENRYRNKIVKNLEKRAQDMGYALVPFQHSLAEVT